MYAGEQALLQVTLVELAHASDTKLIVLADKLQRALCGRIECDVFDGRSQTVFRDVEIEERAANKDSGGMDLLIKGVLAIDQHDVQPFSGEQAGALQAGESGADDGYVKIAHKMHSKLFAPQS